VIRHPALPSLLFLMGVGFMAAAGVIVLAGVVEALADVILDDTAGATEEAEKRGGGAMDGDAETAAVGALRAPLAKYQGETSVHVDAALRALTPQSPPPAAEPRTPRPAPGEGEE
jgi:hypothetical protein